MSKKKKDKKDKQKKQKTGDRLGKVSKNAASLGTALVGAVTAEGTQAALAKMVEKGASDRLDTVRNTIKEAAGAIKSAAGVVHAALDDANNGAAAAATSLTDKAEDTQASVEKVVENTIDTLKGAADRVKPDIKPGKKSKS